MLFDLSFFIDFGLLALRIIVAIVFFSSGKSHATNPEKRGKSMGLSTNATLLLGIAEIIAAISIALGIYIQIGAIIIIIVMLGAIHRKIFVWQTGFYADEGYGWHYDVIFLSAAFLFLGTGGKYILLP